MEACPAAAVPALLLRSRRMLIGGIVVITVIPYR